jgi:pimeloyl-ACP methyl ester carboxylesterase
MLISLLLACQGPSPAYSVRDTSLTATPDDTDPADGPQIVWDDASCPGAAECGYLVLPVDAADPDGPTFELAMARYPAQSRDPKGALFYNFGGPGAPMVESIGFAANQAFVEYAPDYDIVTFDPRGVGGSTPYACSSDFEPVALGTPMLHDLDDIEAMQEILHDYLAPCWQEHPELAAHMGLQHWADDMDALRRALGYEQVLYYGVSGGSALGAQYAERHPEHVERMLLDSNLPAYGGMSHLQDYQDAGLDRLFVVWADWCASTPDQCAVSDDPLGSVEVLWDALQDGPVTSRGRDVGWVTIAYGLTYFLYNEAGWSPLGAALDDARNGDYRGVSDAGDAYHGRLNDGSYDSFLPTFTLGLCANEVDRKDTEALHAMLDQSHSVPIIAPLAAYAQAACTITAPSDDPLESIATAQGAGPIVLLQSLDDFATPIEGAQALHESLDDSVLVTWDSAEHAAYFTSACMHEVGLSFLLDGVVPQGGLTCSD